MEGAYDYDAVVSVQWAFKLWEIQEPQVLGGVWGSAPSVHLKGENSMQYTAAMKQMPMQGLFSFFL